MKSNGPEYSFNISQLKYLQIKCICTVPGTWFDSIDLIISCFINYLIADIQPVVTREEQTLQRIETWNFIIVSKILIVQQARFQLARA